MFYLRRGRWCNTRFTFTKKWSDIIWGFGLVRSPEAATHSLEGRSSIVSSGWLVNFHILLLSVFGPPMCTYLGRKTYVHWFNIWALTAATDSSVVEVQNNFLGHQHGRGRSSAPPMRVCCQANKYLFQIPLRLSHLRPQRNYYPRSTNLSSIQMKWESLQVDHLFCCF